MIIYQIGDSYNTMIILWLMILLLAPVAPQNEPANDEPAADEVINSENSAEDSPVVISTNCENPSYELITGYVYSAPEDMYDNRPGTLVLEDCIKECSNHDTCKSANFETGLCVLFFSSAEDKPELLEPSQFPVFTIYVQKFCPKSVINCNRPWAYERVPGYKLNGVGQKERRVASRKACIELCLNEVDPPCRSANYDEATQACQTSDMDRHTVIDLESFTEQEGFQYLENNCVDDPVKICEFKKLTGQLIKTVDTVFSNVPTLDQCKQKCMGANFRCHSFDYGDTGPQVCRISHHAVATLRHMQDPYLVIENAKTYELSSCYNVTIECRATDMIAKVTTSKIFKGKVYSKGSPNTCVNDISGNLEFALKMPFNDVECNIKKTEEGRFTTDIIVQHHDQVVTSADMGLSIYCQYDLQNTTVKNNVDLDIHGEIQPSGVEETIVSPPNVIMRITDRKGSDVAIAKVGDPLSLVFDILDRNSPYEIFVRNLRAKAGDTDTEIMLIDERGCPKEFAIMGTLAKAATNSKNLEAYFDAFRFPTSEVVSFIAMVTPCIPACEPVQCDIEDIGGQIQSAESFGRKKREVTLRNRRNAETEDLLVVQSIRIADKFGLPRSSLKSHTDYFDPANRNISQVLMEEEEGRGCSNMIGLIVACSMFLLAQLVIIVAWTYFWQKKRQRKLESFGETTTESLSQLYNSGYARRL